jgi:CHASE2 domain-containing sensor protein
MDRSTRTALERDDALSSDRRLDARYQWRWTTLGPILAVVAVFVLTIFDPFDFESVTKRHSANIFYKIYGAVYPMKHRDSISVVLLDDDTLSHPTRNEPWPPSHLIHGEVLSTILSHQPLAVLVDIFFIHAREKDHFERTAYVIDEYQRANVPLFVVAAAAHQAPRAARREILDLEREGKVTLVSADIEAEPGEAPLYPLRRDGYPLHQDGKPYESAALALYRSTCSKVHAAKCAEISDHNSEAMEIVWGLKPAPYNCTRTANTFYDHVCKDLFSSPAGRAIQLLWQAFIPRDWRPTDPMPIPYHATISTDDLLNGAKRASLTDLLKGKVVIYGAQIALVKDFVFSPIHGHINGAFIHAMALDNLLSFGNNYVHQAAGHRTFRKEWTEFQPAALMLLASFVIIWNRRRLLRTHALGVGIHSLIEADERFLLWVRRCLIAVITVAGLIEFFVWSISPFNWLALLIVVHIAHWIERSFFAPINGEAKTIAQEARVGGTRSRRRLRRSTELENAAMAARGTQEGQS